jgi:mycoredoxin
MPTGLLGYKGRVRFEDVNVEQTDGPVRSLVPVTTSSRKRLAVVTSENDIEAVDESAGVIMYCRSWCGDCARARTWLTAHNIPFTEIDVERDPEARDRAAAHNDGRLHTPTFEIGDGVCVDFRPDTLSELLDIV